AESISGRYPSLGPEVIVAAGIPLVDAAGPAVLSALHEGDRVSIDSGRVLRGETFVAEGLRLDTARVKELMERARGGLSAQLEAFTLNTVEYLRRERDLLLDGVGIPDVSTPMADRHVVVVVRGYDYKQDLRALRPYVREHHPVLVGVDEGADALVDAGLVPDLIVGNADSVSDDTLRSGAEIVVHAHRDGRIPGRDRLDRLGLDAVVFPAGGTSEDLAMLLADSGGASLIVAVGTHGTLEEFLDRGRSGMASTFLTRLRVGPKLVDAEAVSSLYRARIHSWQLLLLLVAGLLAVLFAVAATPAGDNWLGGLEARWADIVDLFRGLL
ncbi:MAG: putative cytokinetic ring protein SteA, partial [Actinomycetota bacterium]|nr:putative cytokinetic ring protein SteA [Actinomycetota bacterium]